MIVEEIYIDDNHRVIKKQFGKNYIPQWRPYLFRMFLTRWMGGWSNYSYSDTLIDKQGDMHKVYNDRKFLDKEEALNYLRSNKL